MMVQFVMPGIVALQATTCILDIVVDIVILRVGEKTQRNARTS